MIYSNEVLDNGTFFQQEQIESINRVLHFIDNKCKDISKEDIDMLMECMINNRGNMLIKRVYIKLINLLSRRKREVEKFSQILLSEELGVNERKILSYKYLPFKDSGDIQMESYMYSKFFKDEVYNRYDELVFHFLPKGNKSLLNKVRLFGFYEGICLSNFSRNSKMVGLDRYPSDDVITSGYYQVKRLYDQMGYEMMSINQKKIYNSAVNQYCEKLVYEYEKSYLEDMGRKDLADRVIWVSREVSDDFGFDVLSFDPETECEKMIDVKGTLSYRDMYDFTVSYNEFSAFNRSCSEVNNYYFYRIFIDDSNRPTIRKLSYYGKDGFHIVDDSNHEYMYDSLAFDRGDFVKIIRR